MVSLYDRLLPLRDEAYRKFNSALIPNIDPEKVIGVRTPQLKALARELRGSAGAAEFLVSVPHIWYEENNVHGFLIAEIRDFDLCIAELERFLPHIDNWATCDGMSPRVFKSSTGELLPHIRRWLQSEHTYTVRFAILCLMRYYLDGEFSPEYPELVASVKTEEYYIRMMQAWYFATALAKQWDAVIPYIERRCLEKWTHNKAIQKAIESYRISDEQKALLRTLKVK